MIEAICQMPVTFKERGNISIMELLREIMRLGDSTTITEKSIETYLWKYPETIDSWLVYSADQRSSPNWYLLDPERASQRDKYWIVGFYSGKRTHKQIFLNRYAACAYFIKKQIESLEKML